MGGGRNEVKQVELPLLETGRFDRGVIRRTSTRIAADSTDDGGPCSDRTGQRVWVYRYWSFQG